ncbi:MAG: hypothetical protein KTR16_13365 [Acidiferrobacterales bacterium]|nr:hypothetical protein [Acidiferrobacterales bacterium]
MRKVDSLGDLNLDLLPPKVIMLLSKYAYRLRKTNNSKFSISSKSVFKDLEQINSKVEDDVLSSIYLEIEHELSPFLKKKQTGIKEKTEIKGSGQVVQFGRGQ